MEATRHSRDPASTQRAAFVPIPGGRHMDAYDACAADYWPPLMAFAQAAGVAASGTTPAGSADVWVMREKGGE